jgi:predicted Zn-dependent protease
MNFSRALTASAVVLSLLTGSVTTVAAAPRQDAQKTEKKESNDKKSDKKKEQAATTTTTAPANAKTLGNKEDPRLVGKRNINTGIIGGGSVEKEVRLGQQLAAEVDRQAKYVDDPLITEYVNRVGQNIVLHSDAKIPFNIKVIDSDEANAFALPGGFFYVNKGLLLAADNEAELAGVMAHEIAHVAARHAMENMRKAQLAEIGATIGSIFLGGIPGMIYQSTAGLGLTALFLKFSRGAEEEADRLAAQYLWAAGYDPGAMSTMFEKLNAKNQKKPGFISRAFATHPQTPDRLEASRVLVARFPDREEYVLSTSEFQRVKARMLRLSNARASTVGDITDDEGNRRPTLKRRSPAPDDPAATDGATEEKKDEAPKLKRRDAEPQQNPPAQKDDNP